MTAEVFCKFEFWINFYYVRYIKKLEGIICWWVMK